jgi:hypothetical protein
MLPSQIRHLRVALVGVLLLAAGCKQNSAPSGAPQPLTTVAATRPGTDDLTPKNWTDRSTLVSTAVLIHLASLAPVPVPLDDVTYAETTAGKKMSQAMSRACRESMRCERAARAKFKDVPETLFPQAGEPAAVIASLKPMGDPFFKEANQMMQQIDGDRGVLFDQRAPSQKMNAKWIDGGWKFRFEDVSGGMEIRGTSPFMKEPQGTLEVARLTADAAATLAGRIEAGQIRDVGQLTRESEQAKTEIEAKLKPLLIKS